ncbi:unnamed protein product [Knipowitschia caucasica]|uniref:Uncharacterized protein n=1 Tax=Knipowitschia caucasica TaxID=637954 RepID=A0AAV2JWN9_KNICA
MFMPLAFILFSYGRVLYLCLRRSRSFVSKALNTCLPHVIVLLNYSVCTTFDIMQRSTIRGEQSKPPVTASLILLLAPTVGNPIVYGLKVGEIYRSLKTLLRCGRSEKETRANGNASKVTPQ